MTASETTRIELSKDECAIVFAADGTPRLVHRNVPPGGELPTGLFAAITALSMLEAFGNLDNSVFEVPLQ